MHKHRPCRAVGDIVWSCAVSLVVLAASCPTTPPSENQSNAPLCGDRACNGDETCASCATDCGECNLPACGDGYCYAPESCRNCAADCSVCSDGAVCGDGLCNGVENCDSCPRDCWPCGSCTPDCRGRICGPDNCGGMCPPGCGQGEFCNAQGQCEPGACLPQCAGRICGDNGCGGNCAPGCSNGLQCNAQGQCATAAGCGDGYCDPGSETEIDCPRDCNASCRVVTLDLGNEFPAGADLGETCQQGNDCVSGSCLSVHPAAGSSDSLYRLCSGDNDCLVTGCQGGYLCTLVADHGHDLGMNKCVPVDVRPCPYGAPADCLATGDTCNDMGQCCSLQCNMNAFTCGSLIAGCGDRLCQSDSESEITCPQDCTTSCRIVTLDLDNANPLAGEVGDHCLGGSDCKSGACLTARPRASTVETFRRWCTNDNECQSSTCAAGMACALVADAAGRNAMRKCIFTDVTACPPGTRPDCDPDGESCSDHDTCCSQFCDMGRFVCATQSTTCPDGYCDIASDELVTCPQDCQASCRVVTYQSGSGNPIGTDFGDTCTAGEECKSGICLSARPRPDSGEPWRRWCSNEGACTANSCPGGYACTTVTTSSGTLPEAHCIPNDIVACPVGTGPDCLPPGDNCVDPEDCCSQNCNSDLFQCQ